MPSDYRKISFDLIWWDETGLKIPNQAIVEIDGLKYVVRNRAGYLNKILVNVTKQGEEYSHDCRGIMRIDNKLFDVDFIDIFDIGGV